YNIYSSCSLYIITLFKQFENFLYTKGFTDEAIEIYYEINCERTKIVWYELFRNIKIPFELGFKELFISPKNTFRSIYYFIVYLLKLIWRYLLQWGFGYGVKIWKLILATFIIILIWSLLFWIFDLVEIKERQEELNIICRFGHCFYYSIVSITSLGSEVHVPRGFWGKFLQSSEAILGYTFLAAIVAFLTRKIK
ncbi:MAG: hypothetical protein GF353_15995, partial [Candidatus Lokiarchaeota archaeon]|nr:hypothetical protein [Candidatus Lokiarchaeota archaeon]